jgi:thioredoxin 1
VGFFSSLFGREPAPGKPREVTDDNFEQEVLCSTIPCAVDFWSNRCGPCQVMGGLLSEIGPDYVGRVAIFKLNVDDNWDTAQKYGVSSVPTLVLFRNGRMVDSVMGLIPLNPLRETLDRLEGKKPDDEPPAD